MGKFQACVIVEISTDDARLDPDNLDTSTVSAAAALRRAVLAAMPKDVTRVVMVAPVEVAKLMCLAHDAAVAETGHGSVHRPPPAYVPPTRD
jgi:hypothetical protein